MSLPPRLTRTALLVTSLACLFQSRPALADYAGTPVSIQTDGGWCWFQDPRAIVVNDHLVLGTTAGTTVSGVSTGGDEKVTDYNLTTGVATHFTLKAAYNQDDHASPAFTVLPDNRVLAVYCSHGVDNYVYWRVSTNAGNGTSWGAEQQSTVNITNDGNGNTYSNPFYLSVPNTVYSFSRTIGYDTNYSKFSGLNSTNNSGMTNASNFSYGGHFQYWKNPSNSGAGRPYVKYTSNGTNRIWLATTEDSPQNYVNSLYGGYVEFDAAGAGTVYTATGTSLGPISTGTAPTTAQANTGAGVVSGTGFSYQPTQFSPIVKANANINNYDLSSASPYGAGYAPWASSMCLDADGNPCIAFVVMRDTSGAYGNNLEYGYARLISGAWKVSRIGYAGYGLYSSQNQYAGLIAVDPSDVNKVYFSANVNPSTGVAILGPDGNRHYQIFAGVTTNQGTNWSFTQLTNTSSDNVRPIIATGGTKNVLLWMRGTYTSYTNYNTNIVGLVDGEAIHYPVITLTAPSSNSVLLNGTGSKLRVSANITETDYTGAFNVQWTTVSGPASAVFSDATSADTRVQFPQTGTYVLQISASDAGNHATTSQLTVNVNAGAEDTTSLVLKFKLDESSGTTAADSSGSGFNGTANAVVWQPTGGKIDGAAQFGAANSTITVPDNNTLDTASAFTLSYWFKATTIVDSAGLVSKRGAGTDNNAYTTFTKSDGLLYIDIDRTNANPNRFTSATVFTTAKWYHIAVIFDGSKAAAQRGALYVNGVLDSTGTITSTTIQNSTAALVVGKAAGNTSVFNGLIDDVRFYRRALAPSEVAAMAGVPAAPAVSCGAAPAATSAVAATLSGTASGALTTTWSKVSGPGTATFGNASSPATSVTFSKAGAYVLQLAATNAVAEVSDQVSISVAPNPNVFADWTSTNFPGLTDPTVIGAQADPDHDNLANLLEFALDLSPTQGNSASWIPGTPGLPVETSISISGSDYLSLQVRRPIGRLGITYTSQVSENLIDWTDAVQEGSPVSNGDGSETVIFRDTVPVSGSTRRFIRLNVNQ